MLDRSVPTARRNCGRSSFSSSADWWGNASSTSVAAVERCWEFRIERDSGWDNHSAGRILRFRKCASVDECSHSPTFPAASDRHDAKRPAPKGRTGRCHFRLRYRVRSGVLQDRLDLEADLHVISDQDAPGLERLVPGEIEVPSVDDRLSCESGPLVAPRIDAAPRL